MMFIYSLILLLDNSHESHTYGCLLLNLYLQENSFSAERTIRTVANVTNYKGLNLSRGIRLAVPHQVISGNAAFPEEFNICEMINAPWVDELKWKVNKH